MVGIAEDRELRDVQRIVAGIAAGLEALQERGIAPENALRLARMHREVKGVPVSIFNPELGALESIVKYLREETLLDYRTIARLLGRNEGPIGVTYRRTLKKLKARLDTSSKETIPFEVLRASKTVGLSVFEGIAYHLAKQGHDWHQIARMLHRHDKTVWTILDRAKRKMRAR
jgi:DNA-binding CsgD family transcriptional regulator